MNVVLCDGGREKAGFKGIAKDCVTRSIAIATGKPYLEVYNSLNTLALSERIGKRKKKKSSSNNGVYKRTSRKYLESLGWKWVPLSFIGVGCTTHLKAVELPLGTIIAVVSKHFTVVIDHTIYDTHDPSRDGTRCVYGYYMRNNDEKRMV